MKERRKRIARPFRLTLFGTFFLSLPLINYIGIAIRNQYAIYEFSSIINEYRLFELVLLIIPLLVGIGILLVQKWGYYLFISYSAILIFYNSLLLLLEPKPYNINSFIQTIIIFSAVFYFLKKEVSSPFLFRPLEVGWKPYYQKKVNQMFSITEGFRRSKRKPIKIEIFIDTIKLKTIDFSEGGFYAQTNQFPFSINEEVKLKFKLDQKDFSLKGGVVRIDEIQSNQSSKPLQYKVGIAFRNLTKEEIKELKYSKKKSIGVENEI
jgi:hypothetical protein